MHGLRDKFALPNSEFYVIERRSLGVTLVIITGAASSMINRDSFNTAPLSFKGIAVMLTDQSIALGLTNLSVVTFSVINSLCQKLADLYIGTCERAVLNFALWKQRAVSSDLTS